MNKEQILLIFNRFHIQVLVTAFKYEMGVAYIKGQLDEACHQLTIAHRKQSKDDYYEL